MRILLVLSVFILQASYAAANCRVYVPVKEYNNSGYSIRFDFTKLFSDKNYTEVYSVEESDHQLLIEGVEREGNFHRAVALMKMGETQVNESVVCYTQYCAISDYGKSFSKAYKKFAKILPTCN